MNKGNNNQEIEDAIVIGESQDSNTIEFGNLMDIIIDYYSSTSNQPISEGDEWKRGTDYELKGVSIPNDLDKEIQKTFLHQIKKFQK